MFEQYWFNEVEVLASELKSLVGYGARPAHVIRKPTLRALVANKHPELTTAALKQAIIEELRLAADDLPESEAAAVRDLLVLYRMNRGSAVARRESAVIHLGVAMSVGAWRREPELDFLREFAKVLLGRLEMVTA